MNSRVNTSRCQMKIGQKIKLIREYEGIKRSEFCQHIDMTVDSLKTYEVKERNIGFDNLSKIMSHPQIEKYSLWLITGRTAPAAGQIAPGESHIEIGAIIPKATLTSAFERTMHTSISLGWLTPKEDINFGMLSDVFLSDFEAVGGQVTIDDSPALAPTGTSSKT